MKKETTTETTKDTVFSIEECLVYIQQNLNVPKTHKNEFGGFMYRSASDILEAVKPLASKIGCSITLNDDIIMIGERIYVKSVAAISNGRGSISTTAFAREELEVKKMDAAQITGAASSYARKYALNGLFAIDDTADPDALNNNSEYTQSVKPSIDAAKKGDMIRQSLAAASAMAANVQSREDFGRWWVAYPQLQQNEEFLKIAKYLGTKFPKK